MAQFAQVLADALTLAPEEQATLLSTLIAIGRSVPTTAPVRADVSAPVTSSPKTYKAETPVDTTVPVQVVSASAKDDVMVFRLCYGKTCARNAHDAAKALVKEAGFTWDTAYAVEGKTKGAWAGTYKQAKALHLTTKGGEIAVTAAQVQAVADRKQAKADKRAGKAS